MWKDPYTRSIPGAKETTTFLLNEMFAFVVHLTFPVVFVVFKENSCPQNLIYQNQTLEQFVPHIINWSYS